MEAREARNGIAKRSSTPLALVVLAWLFVGAPLVWGVLQTLKKAAALFQ